MYNLLVDKISSTIQHEIERRLAAGPFTSLDDLLSSALRALDDAHDAAQDLLEKELLRGLEGEDTEMTSAEWDSIEAEAVRILAAKKNR